MVLPFTLIIILREHWRNVPKNILLLILLPLTHFIIQYACSWFFDAAAGPPPPLTLKLLLRCVTTYETVSSIPHKTIRSSLSHLPPAYWHNIILLQLKYPSCAKKIIITIIISTTTTILSFSSPFPTTYLTTTTPTPLTYFIYLYFRQVERKMRITFFSQRIPITTHWFNVRGSKTFYESNT